MGQMNKQIMNEKRVRGTIVVQKIICSLGEEPAEGGGGGEGGRKETGTTWGKNKLVTGLIELIVTRG